MSVLPKKVLESLRNGNFSRVLLQKGVSSNCFEDVYIPNRKGPDPPAFFAQGTFSSEENVTGHKKKFTLKNMEYFCTFQEVIRKFRECKIYPCVATVRCSFDVLRRRSYSIL
jgi:hypothetical protein